MTLRIDKDLLAALKRKAREEGRSVSKEVVQLISSHVEARPAPKRGRTSFGMFKDLDSVGVDEIRALRREVTRRARLRRRPRVRKKRA